MFITNWLVWLGLFLAIAMGLLLIKKPTKKRTQPGHFDNSIHTKPVFKIASIVIFSVVGLYFLTVLISS